MDLGTKMGVILIIFLLFTLLFLLSFWSIKEKIEEKDFSAQKMTDIANKKIDTLKPTIKIINKFIRMLANQGDKYYWHYDGEENLESLKKYYEAYGFKVKILKNANAMRISWEETEEAIDKDLIKYYNYEKEK